MPCNAGRRLGNAALTLALVFVLAGNCPPDPEDVPNLDGRAISPPQPIRPATTAPAPEPAPLVEEPPSTQVPAPTSPPSSADIQPLPLGQKPTTALGHPRSRVAVVIDDMGYNSPLGRQFIQFAANLSFSFLPDAPHTRELAEQAHQAGRVVLAHLPMEPKDSVWKLGPLALRVADTAEEISRKTEEMLDAVPHAAGANNHMGSRFTENGPGMRRVIAVLHRHGLFFVDSFTTPTSLGEATARQLKTPTARRHVFLDNDQEPEKICRQLDQLAAQARQRGYAIGIGHPNQAMFTALERCGPQSFREIELVGVHRLAR